jgi:hypothetical protein
MGGVELGAVGAGGGGACVGSGGSTGDHLFEVSAQGQQGSEKRKGAVSKSA